MKFFSRFLALFLAIVCMASLLTGCGNKVTFLQSVKQGLSIEQFDYDLRVTVMNASEPMLLYVRGSYASPTQCSVRVSATDEGTEEEIIHVCVDDTVLYCSMPAYDSSWYAFSFDSELQALQEELDATVSPENATEYTDAALSLVEYLADTFEKVLLDIKPEVLGKNGDVYSFSLNEENATEVAKAVTLLFQGEAAESFFDDAIAVIPPTAGGQALSSALNENKTEIVKSLRKTGDNLSEFKPEAGKFGSYNLSSELKGKEGERVWKVGANIQPPVDTEDIQSVTLSLTIAERAYTDLSGSENWYRAGDIKGEPRDISELLVSLLGAMYYDYGDMLLKGEKSDV